jgi:hypothetical protein
LLKIWDHIFGTVVDAPEQPEEYGLRDLKMPKLLSRLLITFGLLRQMYAQASSSSSAPEKESKF